MKKLLLIIYLSVLNYANNTEQFLEEIRQNFTVDEEVADNVKMFDDIKESEKKERVINTLENIFPYYLYSDNPFVGMKDDNFYTLGMEDKRFPHAEIKRFLQWIGLYINQHPTSNMSNVVLEKTLVSINNTVKVVSFPEYKSLALLYMSFLDSILCKTTEQKHIIETNQLSELSVALVLPRVKKEYIANVIKVANESSDQENSIDKKEYEKHISKVQEYLSKEIDTFNETVLKVHKENPENVKEHIESYRKQTRTKVGELSKELMVEIGDAPILKEIISRPKIYKKHLALLGMHTSLTYMLLLYSFDMNTPMIEYSKKKRLELLKTCKN